MTGPPANATPDAPRWWQGRLGQTLLLTAAAGVIVALVFLVPLLNLSLSPPAPEVKVLGAKAGIVAPGIYLLGDMPHSAAYAVETSQGLVLVDSGLEADNRQLLAQFARLGLDVQRLRAILLTHVHADHSLGAERLRQNTGAKVHAGRADCDALRKGGPRERFFGVFHMPEVGVHPTTVDVELEGGEELDFGGARFEVIAAPGHTAGSMCYLLHKRKQKILFTGDIIQSLHPNTPGALGTYTAYLPPLYGGNARDYLATLKKLRAMPPPDLVLPGHPRMDATPQAPRLAAGRWHELLDAGVAEMERLIARYDADGADFLDGVFKELLPGLHYLGDLDGRAVYCFRTAKGLFLVDAPGGPALLDFLTERFRKIGLAREKLTAVLLTSADKEATAGLEALVRRTGCKVVVGRAGQEAVARLVPAGTEILTEDDLKSRDWFEGKALPLQGRGLAPVAYQLRLAGKAVLFSGRIPVKASVPALDELQDDVRGPAVAGYLRALDELAKLAPDLWLPAIPVEGQNANVYDHEWERVLQLQSAGGVVVT